MHVRKRIPCQNICLIHTTGPRHVGAPGTLMIWCPFKLKFFKHFRPLKGLVRFLRNYFACGYLSVSISYFRLLQWRLSSPFKFGAPGSSPAGPTISPVLFWRTTAYLDELLKAICRNLRQHEHTQRQPLQIPRRHENRAASVSLWTIPTFSQIPFPPSSTTKSS